MLAEDGTHEMTYSFVSYPVGTQIVCPSVGKKKEKKNYQRGRLLLLVRAWTTAVDRLVLCHIVLSQQAIGARGGSRVIFQV